MRKLTLAAIGMVALTGAAHAGTPWVDQRENRQWNRIYSGIQSGQLTPAEGSQLLKGQARIHAMEHKFKSDGVVTLGERIRLHQALNRQSMRIYDKKHN